LEKANRNATTTELDLRKELDTQRQHMEEEMAALSLQHSKRLEEMIEQHKEELRKLEEIKDEEQKVLWRYERTTRGWGVLPIMACTGRLRLGGVHFKGKGFHKFRYMKGRKFCHMKGI